MSLKGSRSESDLAKKYERYYYFSDNTIKDRLATQAAGADGTSRNPGPPVEKSGRAEKGWDKYYFFSVPFDNSICTGTCRHGRSRPAADGPQTFLQEAFTPDVIARERKKIEARGARTSYAEFFSQLPRAGRPRPDLLGPIAPRIATERPRSGLGASASDPAIPTLGADGLSRPPRRDGRPHGPAQRETTAVEHALAGEALQRHGPYWPMRKGFTKEGRPLPPPNAVDVRAKIFEGGPHRTFQDLHSSDRPAPRSCHYTCGPGM